MSWLDTSPSLDATIVHLAGQLGAAPWFFKKVSTFHVSACRRAVDLSKRLNGDSFIKLTRVKVQRAKMSH
jgi:hypothetical protein